MAYPPQSGPPYSSGPPYQPGPPQHHPQHPQYPPPPQPYMHIKQSGDNSKKFLNMSAGVLLTVIAGVILVCCIGPFALCFFGGFIGAVDGASTPDPTVEITSCKISDSDLLATAEISYKVTNNGTSSEGFLAKFEVKDSSGSRVGDGTDYVSTVAGGATVSESTTVYLDAKGGKTCSLISIN